MKNKMEYAYAGGASADTGSTFGLSGAALKWIAMISMLIDHIGAVVVEYGLYYQGGAECFQKLLENGNGQWLYVLSTGNAYAGTACIPDLCFSSGRGLLSIHTAGGVTPCRCFCLPSYQNCLLTWRQPTAGFIRGTRMYF